MKSCIKLVCKQLFAGNLILEMPASGRSTMPQEDDKRTVFLTSSPDASYQVDGGSAGMRAAVG